MFIRKFNAPEGFGLRLGIEIRRKNDGFWARNPKLGKIWEIGKYREYRYYRYWYRENTEIPVSRKKPISPIPNRLETDSIPTDSMPHHREQCRAP